MCVWEMGMLFSEVEGTWPFIFIRLVIRLTVEVLRPPDWQAK